MREERGGLILGPYEKGAPVCYVDGPDKESEFELFQEDLERIEPHMNQFTEFPYLEKLVSKKFTTALFVTPDGSPIVGPAWGLKKFLVK